MGEDIEETGDFIVNEKDKNVSLTADGVKKVGVLASSINTESTSSMIA